MGEVKYRIIEHMGKYFIQESKITLFGKVEWLTWKALSGAEGRNLPIEFDTLKEAQPYLASKLRAWKENERFRKRGPKVVLEVTE